MRGDTSLTPGRWRYGLAWAVATLIAFGLLHARQESKLQPQLKAQGPTPLPEALDPVAAPAVSQPSPGVEALPASRGLSERSRVARDLPSHRTLSAKYPAGMLAAAQSALQLGDAGKAMELADEIGSCLSLRANREAMERLGRSQVLPADSALSDPAEAARTEAMCQALGTQGIDLQRRLLLLAAAQGKPRATVRVYREQWDPSGTASAQIARWALDGSSALAFNTVLLEHNPAAFGLSASDWNVLCRALALAAQTPGLEREGFQATLFTVQQRAAMERAGAQGPQGHALWKAGQIPAVNFADMSLPAADEQRAQRIAQTLLASVP
ncbi:MAG TPA: hypothetical protein VK195_03515 [Burkholderiaceae bacterium]|nr:hypothetical protein [Burkholderiaceae bacterium]